MENLAMAVAISIKYLESRKAEEDSDNDIRALEEIAACVLSADKEAQEAVITSLQRIGVPDLAEGIGLPNGGS